MRHTIVIKYMLMSAVIILMLLLQMTILSSPIHAQTLKWAPGIKRVDLKLGHSEVIGLPASTKRVGVGDEKIADVILITPRQLFVKARAIGSTNISLWDEKDRLTGVFEVRTIRDLTRLKERFLEVLPGEKVEVRELEGKVLISGEVSSKDVKKMATDLAEAFAPKKVSNLLRVTGGRQVMLKVRFAEVSREVTKRWNINLGIFNPFTGDFLFTLLDGLVTPFDTSIGSYVDESGKKHHTFGTELNFSKNLMGMGGFKVGDTRILGFLDILKSNGLAKILAEPTLVALSGGEADFLAGGEYPIPVPQRENITIEFKKFGVQLAFKPEILSNGRIKLTASPEVSELDMSTAVIVEGFAVPGLTTRRAKAELELMDGQSFAMAGLFSESVADAISKVPMLGEIPILGALFRSSQFRSRKTELVIVVTAHIVKAGELPPPRYPGDGLIMPNDCERILIGATSGNLPENQSKMPMSVRELEGKFGHEVPH